MAGVSHYFLHDYVGRVPSGAVGTGARCSWGHCGIARAGLEVRLRELPRSWRAL